MLAVEELRRVIFCDPRRDVLPPQGGGQPADVGTITPAGGAGFAVAMVRKGPTGVVAHEAPKAAGGRRGGRARLARRRRREADLQRARALGGPPDRRGDDAQRDGGKRPTKATTSPPARRRVRRQARRQGARGAAADASGRDGFADRRGHPNGRRRRRAGVVNARPPNALPADRALWGRGGARRLVGDQGAVRRHPYARHGGDRQGGGDGHRGRASRACPTRWRSPLPS